MKQKIWLAAVLILCAGTGWTNELIDRGQKAYDSKNYGEALKWFRQAAEKGDAQADVKIGDMYRDGEGVKEDDAEALKWYQKAMDLGDLEGESEVGAFYYQG